MSKFYYNLESIGNHSKILVIGDVHGDLEQFNKAVFYALKNNMFIISLGDLVDYGSGSKEIVLKSYDLITQNKMITIKGNHERKFAKYIKQKREGNVRVVINAALKSSIDSFDNDDNAFNIFLKLNDTLVNVLQYKNIFFSHGAIHRDVFINKTYSPAGYQLSLFGELDEKLPALKPNGFPNRVFYWVNKVPDDITCFVGHDIRSFDAPVISGNNNNVIFLDTGCSKYEREVENPKKGFLSGCVLDKNGNIEKFKRFDR
jgi:predicted phosphodiesterase